MPNASATKTQNPTSLLLLNGGVGKRLKLDMPKQFYKIHGHPLMAFSIIAAMKIQAITEIIINAPSGYEDRTKEILDHYASGKAVKLVEGGRSRQISAQILAEAACNDQVILHETARPLVTTDMYKTLLEHDAENVGYFDAIPFSMCRVDPETRTVRRNVRRDRVFNIQLPQKFDRATLVKAHETAKAAKKTFTEDAVMVHKMTNTTVHALDGDPRNIKVTSHSDLITTSQLMSKKGLI